MTSDLKTVSDQLRRQLRLEAPPVQISYVDEPPSGVPEHPGGVPSVCTFFAVGAERPFYAGLRAHEDCEIGAFVLGIPPTGEVGARLQATLAMMHEQGYLNPGEEAGIPRNPTPPRFVAYGPLGSLPVSPTGVLLFVTPEGAMLAAEAAGSGPHGAPMSVHVRPMCSLLPILASGTPVAASFGCVGSRLYADLPSRTMIVGIRGDRLVEFAGKLDRVVRANQAVGTEDAARKKKAAHPHRRGGRKAPPGRTGTG